MAKNKNQQLDFLLEAGLAEPVLVKPANPPKRSVAKAETLALSLFLPATGRSVTADYALIDPALCHVSELNRRVQRLLSVDNAEVASLIGSIAESGQREPVLVRRLPKGRFEVIYGSRRRFAVAHLAQTAQPDLKLKAWVIDDLADEDAKQLAIAENQFRADLSAWEVAQYLWEESIRRPDVTHEQLAQEEGMSRSLVTRYLLLAELDERFLHQLTAPSAMSLTSGLALRKLISDYGPRVMEALSQLKAQPRFSEASKLIQALKQKLQIASKPGDGKQLLTNSAGKVVGKMTPKRSKKGSYSIDITGLNEAQAQRLKQFLEQLSSD